MIWMERVRGNILLYLSLALRLLTEIGLLIWKAGLRLRLRSSLNSNSKLIELGFGFGFGFGFDIPSESGLEVWNLNWISNSNSILIANVTAVMRLVRGFVKLHLYLL